MRLMTLAEGPARLSRLSNAQAVLRPTPGQWPAWRSYHIRQLPTLRVSLRASKPACFRPVVFSGLLHSLSTVPGRPGASYGRHCFWYKKDFRLIKASGITLVLSLRPIIGEFVPIGFISRHGIALAITCTVRLPNINFTKRFVIRFSSLRRALGGAKEGLRFMWYPISNAPFDRDLELESLIQTACRQFLFPAAVSLAAGSRRKPGHPLTCVRRIGASGLPTVTRPARRETLRATEEPM